jgi:Flp pilus assembly protein TadD
MALGLHLPASGVLLSHVVTAFGLRQWDRGEILRGRSAARYFSGERVGAEAEAEIVKAVAATLAEANVFPLRALLRASEGTERDQAATAAVLGEFLVVVTTHWDQLVGGLQSASVQVWSERLAQVACLQLVTIDLAVRLTAASWLLHRPENERLVLRWTSETGVRDWLRDLVKKSKLSRDALAIEVQVAQHTLDAWLDGDTRPNDENLRDLALVLAADNISDADLLLQQLRQTYGLREIYALVTGAIGEEHAQAMVKRLADYVMVMTGLVGRSRKSIEENNFKMRLALTLGTLWRDGPTLPFVDAMLNTCWRFESDPVWRTSIKAATRSWFERLQEVSARISKEDREYTCSLVGQLSDRDTLEQVGYMSLASKGEIARDPAAALAMDVEAADPGRFGAVELKLRAGEAANVGARLEAIDLLRAAVSKDPCDAELHFRLGANLWQIADVDEGLKELEIAVQLDPSWDRSHVEVAIVYLNQDRNAEAACRLEHAKQLVRAPSPWLLLHLGFARERLGEIEPAIHAYEELLAQEPDHAEGADRLAHLYLLRGEKRRGAALAKHAAHLGFTDVFDAWQDGFYNRKDVQGRPPRKAPDHVRCLGDNTWLNGDGRSRYVDRGGGVS